jgi:hypothetical protein
MGDHFRDIARELFEPFPRECRVHHESTPARRDPGVDPHHETIRVADEERPPRGVQDPSLRNVHAERELDPKVGGQLERIFRFPGPDDSPE